MSAPLKISFVVPVYQAENVRAYFDACIQSLTDQTYPHTEIILVAGLPSTQTAQIIQDLSHQHTQIEAITHTQSQGQGPSRNVGAKVATGDYIWFVDQDDLVAPNACQILADEVQAHGSPDIIHFDWGEDSKVFIAHLQAPSQLIRYEDYDKSKHHRFAIDSLLFNRYKVHVAPWQKIIKAKIACAFQFPDFYPEDISHNVAILVHAQNILYVHAALYVWREHGANTHMITKRKETVIDHIKSLQLTRQVAQRGAQQAALKKFLRCHDAYLTWRCIRRLVKFMDCSDPQGIYWLRQITANTWRANASLARNLFDSELYSLHYKLRASITTWFGNIGYCLQMARTLLRLISITIPMTVLRNSMPVLVQKIKSYPRES